MMGNTLLRIYVILYIIIYYDIYYHVPVVTVIIITTMDFHEVTPVAKSLAGVEQSNSIDYKRPTLIYTSYRPTPVIYLPISICHTTAFSVCAATLV